MNRTLLILFMAVMPWPTLGQTNNAELARMFAEDQAIRKGDSQTDWAIAQAEDARRRQAVQDLLDAGRLNSGTDYYHAAFIFQHGQNPADYLKAHALAVIATSKGRTDATWITAATLDRYLHSIGQKQIYGTQYRFPTDDVVTQDPYDRKLLPDSIRAASGVPDLASQEKRLGEIAADISK